MQRSGLSAVFTSLKAHKYALASGLLLAALPIGYAASNGTKAHSFVAAAFADPLAVLEGRSPGERKSGQLAQTKRPKGPPNLALKPSERVLANVRTRPGAAPAAPEGGTQGPLETFPGLLDAPAPAQAVVADTVPATAIANIGGVGGGLPVIPGVVASGGGAAGGGGAPGAPGTGTQVPTAVVPVPEPAAWLMMISGFMLMGMSLRSRQRPIKNGSQQNT